MRYQLQEEWWKHATGNSWQIVRTKDECRIIKRWGRVKEKYILRESPRDFDPSVCWINSRPFPHHEYHPRLMHFSQRWAGSGCRGGFFTCSLRRGSRGGLIPEAWTISVLVPAGQMCSRWQYEPKRGINHFQLDDSPLHLLNPQDLSGGGSS